MNKLDHYLKDRWGKYYLPRSTYPYKPINNVVYLSSWEWVSGKDQTACDYEDADGFCVWFSAFDYNGREVFFLRDLFEDVDFESFEDAENYCKLVSILFNCKIRELM